MVCTAFSGPNMVFAKSGKARAARAQTMIPQLVVLRVNMDLELSLRGWRSHSSSCFSIVFHRFLSTFGQGLGSLAVGGHSATARAATCGGVSASYAAGGRHADAGADRISRLFHSFKGF